jgi:N-hydroxyarylamine O-acetyltransferase
MIAEPLVEQVLQKLGFRDRPTNDLAGLEDTFGRWCRKVPFDNIQKRLALAADAPGPLPGNTAEDILWSWLAYGTGGTCWATSHGLHDLLQALGFDVVRATGTMLSSPDARGPNHGTIVARIDGEQYIVDGSMLTDRPIPLREWTHES